MGRGEGYRAKNPQKKPKKKTNSHWLSGWPKKVPKLYIYHKNGLPKKFKVHELRK